LYKMFDIANKHGTPVYVYEQDKIVQNIEKLGRLQSALKLPLNIRYAVKANPFEHVLRLMADHGLGAEVVSGGEMLKAISCGIAPSKIVFSGVGKTDKEISLAIDTGIEQINVESIEELYLIAEIASQRQELANIALRVCPDVDGNTHDKITTGRAQDKFGICRGQLPEAYKIINDCKSMNFKGFAVHIGSQISAVDPYLRAFMVMEEIIKDLSDSMVHGGRPITMDLGGGFCVPYKSDDPGFNWDAYTNTVNEIFYPLSTKYHLENNIPLEKCITVDKVIIEPGRFLVADAGVLLTRVLYVKRTPHKIFVIVDAGMNDMMRTALYGVYHEIEFLQKQDGSHHSKETMAADVVGPVCESSDYFAKDINVPKSLSRGDLLAIKTTGAYGASLASTYNGRSLVAEVML